MSDTKLPPGWAWCSDDDTLALGPAGQMHGGMEFSSGPKERTAGMAWDSWVQHSGMTQANYEMLVRDHKTLKTLTGDIAVLMDRRCDGKMSDREFLSFLRTAIEPDVATEGLGGQ